MASDPKSPVARKEIVKSIIRGLHEGVSAEQSRARFEAEVGEIGSSEIAEIEQSLINEGMSPDEIKKLCNVHALLFQSSLRQALAREESPEHPVSLFKQENRAIEAITRSLRDLARDAARAEPGAAKARVAAELKSLKGVELHYARKEQLLFPYLERHGFFGPSKVMWGKDDEVRGLLKRAVAALESVTDAASLTAYAAACLAPLVEEVDGMVFKEENILFPTALEKLSVDEWIAILTDSDEVGYAFIGKPKETSALIADLRRNAAKGPELTSDGHVAFPTGTLGLAELMGMLDALPVDITFVGSDDTVRYFSNGRDRVFMRTPAVIGRKVQNCHPPQSVHIVQDILDSFRGGRRSQAEFWIPFKGRFIHIRYFAVRDAGRNYLGTLEVTQDVTDIRALTGQKRLLDDPKT